LLGLLREILKGLLWSVIGAKDLARDLAGELKKRTLKGIRTKYRLVGEGLLRG
jgi:hypothetical protein